MEVSQKVASNQFSNSLQLVSLLLFLNPFVPLKDLVMRKENYKLRTVMSFSSYFLPSPSLPLSSQYWLLLVKSKIEHLFIVLVLWVNLGLVW